MDGSKSSVQRSRWLTFAQVRFVLGLVLVLSATLTAARIGITCVQPLATVDPGYFPESRGLGTAADGLPIVGDYSAVGQKRSLVTNAVCDFGVVSPLTLLSKTLTIQNDSNSRWTVASLRTSCGCAVASISPSTIEPSKSATIDLTYRPGSLSVDDERRIEVSFREPTAPQLVVTIRAQVRPPLSVSEHQILFQECHDETPPVAVKVWNYGETRWKGITATAMQGYVVTDTIDGADAELPVGACQSWVVNVRPMFPESAPDAVLFDEIRIQSVDNAKHHQADVRVELLKSVGVRVAPKQILVRPARNGMPTRTTLYILFPNPISTIGTDVSLRTDFPGKLTHTWSRINDRSWRLTIELTPTDAQWAESTSAVEIHYANIAPVVLPILTSHN